MSFSPISKQVGPLTFTLSDQGNGVFQVAVALSASLDSGLVVGGGNVFANLNAVEVEALGFDEFNKILPSSVQPIAEAVEAEAEAATKNL